MASLDEAWAEKSSGELDGIPVNFIGRKALLRNKEATGRSKDKVDAYELRKQDNLRE
jgi:hypothetical protein